MEEKQAKYNRSTLGVHKINAFDVFNVIFFTVLSIVMLYPFWSVLMTSLVGPVENVQRMFILWPRKFNFGSYQYILTTGKFTRSFWITAFITIVGTAYNMFLTTTCAYALSKKILPGYKFFVGLITFTMFFGGGLIPWYMLIRALGLMNTVWVMIVGSIGVWDFVVMRAFITQIPEGLEESAMIDGANELRIFVQLIIPLSVPVIAALSLFSAVGLWNSYFSAMLFLQTRPDLYPLQLLLRNLIVQKVKMADADLQFKQNFGSNAIIYEDGIKMAAVIVATAPILIVYPFVQKYFVKGIYLGSLKG